MPSQVAVAPPSTAYASLFLPDDYGGRADTLAFNSGTVTLEGTSIVDVELSSAGVFDRLTGNAAKTLLPGASLNVSFLNAYVPAPPTY